MTTIQELSQALMHLDDKLTACMRCGNCQAVCPIFAQSLRESDVARGKIVLIQNLAHEIIQNPDAVAERLDRCLLCGSCQANCASGVCTQEIFFEARHILTLYRKLPVAKRLIFRELLPYPKLFSLSHKAGYLFQGLVLRKAKNSQGTCTAPLLKFALGEKQIPRLAPQQIHTKYRKGIHSTEKKKKIIFYPGCMTDNVYTQIGDAAMKIFKHYEIEVLIPQGLVCCGLPSLVSGDHLGFQKQLDTNVKVFQESMQEDFDYIITPCPSCTETLHLWWKKYNQDTSLETEEILQSIAEKTIEIHSFLYDVLNIEPSKENKKNTEDKKESEDNRGQKEGEAQEIKENSQAEELKTYTYHESCHLNKSLKVSSQVKKLMAFNQDYSFIPMQGAELCCGCGGSFTLSQPSLSADIGSRKRNSIVDTKAHYVATACPACMLQLNDMLARNKDSVQVKHSLEILAESL